MSVNSNYTPHSEAATERYRSAGHWNDEKVIDWVVSWAATTPDNVAVHQMDGQRCTYLELDEKSLRFANALLALGIKPGDVVAIQLPSSIAFLIAYLAVTRIGAVLATMHMPYREGELEPLVRFADARAVICAPASGSYEGPAMMIRLRDRTPGMEHVILAWGSAGGADCLSMQEMMNGAATTPIGYEVDASWPALLCYTSGTSAAPKAVMRSYESLTANARTYVREIDQTQADRALIGPPFTHVFGLLCANNTLYTGGTILPLTHFEPKLYTDMIEALRPSLIYSAPAHLAATLKSGTLRGRDLSSVRDVVLGGSICPPRVAAAFEDQLPNGRVGALFGMTEVLLVTQTSKDGLPAARHGSVGRPISGVEARIVSGSGEALPYDQEGELQLSGFSILPAYVKNPDANVAAFTSDGWFRTGDLAVWDEAGNIVITGRVKDLINRGGIKINPSDLEGAIMDHKAVVLAAVVPMPDDILGERICAFVTLVPGATLELDALCRFLDENGVAKMRWPERLIVIDEMPMTPTRKIIKGALQTQLRAT